jgi:hypothetical protein
MNAYGKSARNLWPSWPASRYLGRAGHFVKRAMRRWIRRSKRTDIDARLVDR